VENFETQQSQSFGGTLPKPILEEDKKNWVRKSLISLAIYAFLFKFIFNLELIYIAAVLVVLLIHEFGHFFAMKFFNYTNVKMFVLPLLGAYVTGTKKVISQRQMSIVILAGPAPGILIGIGLLVLNMYYPNSKFEMLGNIFVGLNFFNLLPFMPLDGGRLLETLFINHNHTIRVVFTIISILFLLLFALQSIFFLIIPISMAFDLYMEIKNQKLRDFLKQENVNYFTDYQDLPDKNYWLIRDGILLSFNKRYKGISAGVQQYSPIEGSIIQHVMAVLKMPIQKDLNFLGKALFFILFLCFLILPIVFYIPKFLNALQQVQQ
jgi:stage IV sporulation protein FB